MAGDKMTDLKKRADEYAIKVAEKNVMPKDGFAEHLIRQTYLDATKAETALLSQHILDLQKDKGNLTDRVRELEQQIEKMKCCENCGWYYLQQHWRESEEINESRMFHCGTCGNKRNWKIREIKEK